MDLANFLQADELSRAKSSIKKVFFYRICGTGMGACACLAKSAGFDVAGADLSFSPPMSDYLNSLNIPLLKLDDLNVKDLQEYDLVVVGNSVPRMSEYARFVEGSGVRFTSFPSFLGEFILKNKNVIGLAGTHGKTTTTYFLTQMLEKLSAQPGYFIGGIMDNRPPATLGEGSYFAIESDEYDSAYFQKISKFRLYELNHMILTSLEFDHADIFDTIEDIKDEFRSVLKSFEGFVVANCDYPAVMELHQEFPDVKWILYGEGSENGPFNFNGQASGSSFSVKFQSGVKKIDTQVAGFHNVLNITGCLLLLERLGFDSDQLIASASELGLVKRRQEERGYYKQCLVIDDFAHHPKAITLTLQALKQKYPDKKIITVFEPISATARSSIFQEEFTDSLKHSSEVVLAMNPLKTTVKDTVNLNGVEMAKHLNAQGVSSAVVNNLDELMQEIERRISADKILVVLSNRTCLGLWESSFVQALN